MIATAVLLTGVAGKLLAVHKFGMHGVPLLVLLVLVDVLVILASNHH